MKGKAVIPLDEMESKIKAASQSRKEEKSDLVIVGRTDSLAIEGVDQAIDRVKRYHKAGADVLFIEAPDKQVKLPLLLNQLEGGRTPLITMEQAKKIGFKIILFPLTSLYSSTKAMFDSLSYLKKHQTSVGIEDQLVTFDKFNKIVNYDDFIKLEKKFSNKK